MTRTTDLLKGMKFIKEKNKEICKKYGKPHNILYRTNHYSEYTEMEAELKGRLDALKEEVEFLKSLGLVKIKEDENLDFETVYMNDTFYQVDNRIKYLQEEIKLIETAGVGK